MAKALWSGSISFGLVNIPVKLYPAVSRKDIQFNQFEEATGDRIRYKRVSEESGREVPYERIVKGYEVDRGRYVVVTPQELEAIEPRSTRTLDVEDFVALAEVDPIYYEHAYYLAPDGERAARAYTLLLRAMERSGRVGIGRFVMRAKEYLAAIRPLDGLLALETLLFSDEVVDPAEIDELPSPLPEVSERELSVATQLVDSLTTAWDPIRYRDTYRQKVLELIARKVEGEELVVEEAPPRAAPAADLVAALEASLEAAKKARKRPA